MPEPICRIICASAGTGKTYRLSLEYIAILLQYYGKAEFEIDNILALTFTRKATAEIRERIFEHLELLLETSSDNNEKKRSSLISNLRCLVPGGETELSFSERSLLYSAWREICCDNSRLQVMTIDAYIGNIFRNIVRPLRNIETFEIDTQAVTKRMPLLMNHLMKPEYRDRLSRLLSRKISRSLDDYTRFFSSLVEGRWLYYMLRQRIYSGGVPGDKRVVDLVRHGNAEDSLVGYQNAMRDFFAVLQSAWQIKGDCQPEDLLNADFKRLADAEGQAFPAILQTALSLINDVPKAEKLLGILATGKNVWNATRLSKAKFPDENDALTTAIQNALLHLANYLMLKLYLPEQQEIIDLWGIILSEYDRLIYRYKNMTYNDISWFSFEALFSQDPPFFEPQSEVSATEFYQFLSHRTRFLLIDEFQDTSLIQFNILKPIITEVTAGEGSKPFGGLIVVGDEKQSIFGWRGGERDLLLNLNSIFPTLHNVSIDRLDSSWRCPPSMMTFVNRLFSDTTIHSYLAANNMQWQYMPIRSEVIEHEAEVEIDFCLEPYSRTAKVKLYADDIYADFVQRIVAPVLKADPTGSIAILCRKGRELASIQQALDDEDISSLYQPDLSICLHQLVSPLLEWLRYVAWGDWSDLLGFLRSDYLRIDSTLLKAAVDLIAAHEQKINTQKHWQPCDFSSIPLIRQFVELAVSQHIQSPSPICQAVVDLCLAGKELSERDYLNLHHFLGIVSDWELSNSHKPASIPDFLAYLKDNSYAEDFKQQSISGDDSLQLLTIHKSKGLQFRRVFVFYNLSGGYREDKSLSWAIDYLDKDFHFLRDYSLSYHYQNILKASDCRGLWEASERRKLLEEMNTLYVAFTRAETKLHLYFCYEGTAGWEDYLSKKVGTSLPVLLCDACLSYFRDKASVADGIWHYRSELYEGGEVAGKRDSELMNLPEGKEKETLGLLNRTYFDTPAERGELKRQDISPHINWRQTWLVDRSNLIGELLHYYLSFIFRNTSEEHNYAFRRCLAFYGSIISTTELQHYLIVCKGFCEHNIWLFDEHWDIVKTELELKSRFGLLRIDRLMISRSTKEALIVDYKSGEVHESDQLDNYKAAVQSLPGMKDFEIAARICHIDL